MYVWGGDLGEPHPSSHLSTCNHLAGKKKMAAPSTPSQTPRRAPMPPAQEHEHLLAKRHVDLSETLEGVVVGGICLWEYAGVPHIPDGSKDIYTRFMFVHPDEETRRGIFQLVDSPSVSPDEELPIMKFPTVFECALRTMRPNRNRMCFKCVTSSRGGIGALECSAAVPLEMRELHRPLDEVTIRNTQEHNPGENEWVQRVAVIFPYDEERYGELYQAADAIMSRGRTTKSARKV